MTLQEILQWISQGLLAGLLVFLAFKRAPSEKSSLDSGAVKSYAEAAKMAGESARTAAEEMEKMEKKHEDELAECKKRLELLESKAYRITINFTIGEPPTVGIVNIEPMILNNPRKT